MFLALVFFAKAGVEISVREKQTKIATEMSNARRTIAHALEDLGPEAEFAVTKAAKKSIFKRNSLVFLRT